MKSLFGGDCTSFQAVTHMTSPSAAGLQGVLEDGHLRKMDPTPDGFVAAPAKKKFKPISVEVVSYN